MIKIEKISLKNKRVFVMSDLHGELSLFNDSLCELNFNKDDILIINGDICEKGENSLGLVRRILELKKTHTVYCVMGNCDTVGEDLRNVDNASLLEYMLERKQSIFNEMCHELKIEVNEQLDVDWMKEQLLLHFKEEIDFLDHLPILLESESYIFVHGGIESENLENLNPLKCLTFPSFMSQDVSFKKCVVVGHWPVCNYGKEVCDFNIRYDKVKNMIGIDGGLTIKSGCQLNVLVLENEKMRFESFDMYPKVIALEAQEESPTSMNLCYPNTRVEILERNEKESKCYFPEFDQTRVLLNENLYDYKGFVYCYDEVYHDLKIHKGEVISLIKKSNHGYYVKKNGITGWYHKKIKEA